jgi:hypothetical protein
MKWKKTKETLKWLDSNMKALQLLHVQFTTKKQNQE